MPPERVSQPAMPAVTLAAQHLERGRGLRPGDRIGNKLDPVRPPLLVAPAPQPQDQFYILAPLRPGGPRGGGGAPSPPPPPVLERRSPPGLSRRRPAPHRSSRTAGPC